MTLVLFGHMLPADLVAAHWLPSMAAYGSGWKLCKYGRLGHPPVACTAWHARFRDAVSEARAIEAGGHVQTSLLEERGWVQQTIFGIEVAG